MGKAEERGWSIEKDGLTQSMITAYLACPEQARLSYREQLSSGSSFALDFGTAFHSILDKVYGYARDYPHLVRPERALVRIARKEAEALEKTAKDALGALRNADSDTLAEIERLYGMAGILAGSYFEAWAKTDYQQMKWRALEEVFKVPLEIGGVTIPIRGKFDGVAERRRCLWLFETKTKGEIPDSFGDSISINFQVNLYLWAIKHHYGQAPEGVIYNIARRPQLHKKADEPITVFLSRVESDIAKRPDWYFRRYEVKITKNELEEWERGFRQVVWDMVQWSRGHRHSFKNSGACTGRGWNCPHIRICTIGDYSYHRKRPHVFPELEV